MVFDLLKKNFTIYCLFFGAFFLYVLLVVDPSLYFLYQNPEFFTHSHFFKKHLIYPGGLIDYISLYLTTMMSIPVVGAIITTALIIIITYAARMTLEEAWGERIYPAAALIPAFILTGLHGNFGHPIQYDLYLILTILPYLLCRRIMQKSNAAGFILYIVIMPLILYTGGIIPFVLFTVLVSVRDFTDGIRADQFFKVPVLMICAVILPYLFYNYLFMRGLSFELKILQNIVSSYTIDYIAVVPFVFFPCAVSAVFFKNRIKGFYKKLSDTIAATVSPKGNAVAQMIIIAVISLSISIIMFDRHSKKLYTMHKLCNQQKWHKAAEIGREFDSDDIAVHLMRNRALYQSGLLLDHLFDVPQKYGVAGLVFSDDSETWMLVPFSLVAFDLGDINQSIRWSYEVIAHYGYCSTALRQLIVSNIIKEQYHTASKLLTMLEHTPLQKKWVKRYRSFIADPELLKNESDLITKRKQLPYKIYSDKDNHPYMTIIKNLFFNEKNKMAFEYLLMGLLLEQKLDEFVSYLTLMDQFGYGRAPKHIQEALCVYVSVRTEKKQTIVENFVSAATWNQFQNFTRIRQLTDGNGDAMEEKLKTEFGNTYWYYLQFVYPKIREMQKKNEASENDSPYIVKK